MPSRLLASLALALLLTASAGAQEPKLPDVRAFDKMVSDSLRDVHDKGATIYNDANDFAGAFRLYEGALAAVRPLLAHRPAAQKLIDTGFAAADKVPEMEGKPNFARKAFLLHETIEAVRKELKTGFTEPTPPKKPEDKKPPEKKPEEKKPADKLSGTVTLQGKPLAEGEVTLVTLDAKVPRTFTAAVKDGKYTFAEALPVGKFVVIVTGKGVPEKYTLTNTSALTFALAAGPAQFDLDLK
jgi:hypothetical protein